MDEQLHAGAGQPEGAFPPSSPQLFPPSAMGYLAMAPPRPPRPPQGGLPRWLKVGGVAAALMLGVGGAAAGANALIAQAANGPGGASPFSILSQAPFAGHTGHPNGFGGHQRGGDLTVSSVSGQTITTKDASGATVTVKVSSSTHYTRLGKTVSLGAITAGEMIHARGTRNSDGSIAASRIDIEVPTYGGQVTAISGSAITIQDRQGASHSIHTTTSTSVERGDATSTVSAIAVGDQIVASGARNSDGSLNAEVVTIMPAAPHGGSHGDNDGPKGSDGVSDTSTN